MKPEANQCLAQAQQLAAQGETVTHLLLLEAPPLTVLPRLVHRAAKYMAALRGLALQRQAHLMGTGSRNGLKVLHHNRCGGGRLSGSQGRQGQ